MATLLKRAQDIKTKGVRHKFDELELEELSLEWLKGNVTWTQITKVVGLKGSTAYGLLAVTLKRLYQKNGVIK